MDNLKLGLEWRRQGVEDAKRLRHVQVQPLAGHRLHDPRPDLMMQATAAENASCLARASMRAAERAAGTPAARASVAAAISATAAAAASATAPQSIPADYVPPNERTGTPPTSGLS